MTAASIHEATGHAVAVAFNAGNLKAVAGALRQQMPNAKLILCADADAPQADGRPGVGIGKATEAALAVGGWLALPFADAGDPGRAIDFNDLAQQQGHAAVKACIDRAREMAGAGAPVIGPLVDDAAEIARLAALPPLEYDRQRKSVAERMGCRPATLDAAVMALRQGNAAGGTGQGRRLILSDPEPWPVAVDGAALLDEIAATLRRFLVLPEPCGIAATLWIVHGHAVDASPITPRLAITSPEKRCGKSTLLRLIGALVARPLPTASITAAALFRAVEAARPSLLIDEADTFLAHSEDLRGIVNAGHARDGTVIRTVGEDLEPRAFSCWAPVAIACIGKLPGTIEDRSVMIAMRRRRSDEPVERLRLDRLGHFEPIKRRCARWVDDHAVALTAVDPDVPASLNDRAADNWRPLLAIADVAGGAWPDRARRASVELSGSAEDDDNSVRAMLLADIRGLFAERDADRLASADLAEHLGGLEHRPWPEWNKGHPITPRQVARLLAPFGIAPSTVRIGSATPKGYDRQAFADAFARYLPADPQQCHNRHKPPLSKPGGSATDAGLLRSAKPQCPAEDMDCGGVADGAAGGFLGWENDL